MQAKAVCSSPTSFVGNRFIRTFLVAAFLLPSFCNAQVQEEKQSAISESQADDGKVAPADSNAALLQELEAMRQRIEQLEMQLKTQSKARNETTATDTAGQLQAARQSMLADTTVPVVPSPATPASRSSERRAA